MARVHEQLYRAQNLTQVHLQSYLNDLVQSLQQSYGADHVVITLDISDVTLPVDIAIPCGLIVNELVTNALKYAFPRGAGSDDDEIVVSLHRTDAGTCTLTVSDNGRGLPEDFTIEGANGNETLGMFLVGTFVQQLEGTLTWHGGQGTTWRITFPYREPSPLPQD
jgi:two-component sensor histidine kinase